MPTTLPTVPPLGEEKGRTTQGWEAEPTEVLSPGVQVSVTPCG